MKVTYAELYFNTSQSELPGSCEAKDFCPVPALPGPPDTSPGENGGAVAPMGKSGGARAVVQYGGLWDLSMVLGVTFAILFL